MSRSLFEWSRKTFYPDCRAIHDERLSFMNRGMSIALPAVWLIQTPPSFRDEKVGTSRRNNMEAVAIRRFVQALGGVDLGIISPYRAQVDKLRDILPGVSVCTCDTFQGDEKSAIIISMTRNHTVSEFLTDPRRLNMALTRAAKHVAIFGNIDMLKHNSSWATLISIHKDAIIEYPKFVRMYSAL